MKEKIYLPTLTQAILIPIITLLALLASNFTLIKQMLLNEGGATAIADTYVSSLGQYLDNPVMNSGGVFVFWVLVGVVGYAIVAGLGMIIHAYSSDLSFNEYVRPVAGRSEMLEKFVRFLLRSMALFGLIAWFVGTVWFVVPWVDQKFGEMLAYGYIPLGVVAYIVAATWFFMPIFLSRLFVLRTRVYDPESTPF
jgi:hypothetical protein